ncbi:flagellar protein FlgN [Aceticella autotrophica]|uniref:Flagellar protein FlgN n=2 Tax=Aceticella autotrophica TaxID=2755338 RepID=A0A975GBD2_9THEO|nr:flagellar protein FlgN [Aceticella autotrophica]
MQNIKSLVEILNGELLLYKDLLDIAVKKTDIIVQGKINELDKITKIEGNIILKLANLEDKRESSLRNFSKEKEITITELCKILPAESEEMKKLQKNLKDVLNKLEQRNSLNKSLINQSLEYINSMIDFISSSLEQDNGMYEATGTFRMVPSSLIDKKV